jgi:hypothetical protein
MSRRNKKSKKHTNKYNYDKYNYDNPHYRKYNEVATSKDVAQIAFKVFGSLYYTPNK